MVKVSTERLARLDITATTTLESRQAGGSPFRCRYLQPPKSPFASKEVARSMGLLRQKAPRSDMPVAVIARLAFLSESKQSPNKSKLPNEKNDSVIEPKGGLCNFHFTGILSLSQRQTLPSHPSSPGNWAGSAPSPPHVLKPGNCLFSIP